MSDPLGAGLAWLPLIDGGLAAAAAGAATVVLGASWWGSRGLARGRRLALLGLRAVAVVALALIAAGPTRVRERERVDREPWAVIVDASRSMQVADGGEPRRSVAEHWLATAKPALDALSARFDVQILLAGSTLRPWDGGPLPADDVGSDLGGALTGLREALGGTAPAGALLISDGADRAALGRSADPATLLAGLPFPVSTWVIGGSAPIDLSIESLSVPPFGFVRRPLVLTARIRGRGLRERRFPLTLRADGEVVDSATVELDEQGVGEVRFEVRPDTVGFHTWSLEAPRPEGDAVPSNNLAEATVKIVRDRTRVLQLTSRPSWDVRFLRRLLKTDPNVDLVSFFILREDGRQGQLVRNDEELSLIAFPHESLFGEDLQAFDLVIFQNFTFQTFLRRSGDPYLRALHEYVERGGALAMVGGDLSFAAGGFDQSPIAADLPGDLSGVGTQGPWQPTLTEAGKRHPVTRLGVDAAASAARWAGLPPLVGSNPLGALHPDAVALLRAGADGPVVIAARDVGRGRVLALATDSWWRWALDGGDQDASGAYAALWRNALRWLVRDAEQRQVEVLPDHENHRVGDVVRGVVRVLGPDYAPRPGVRVEGAVRALDGGAAITAIGGETDAQGELPFELRADAEGTLRITADVPSIPRPFGTGEARVSVGDRGGELEDPAARPDLMRIVAEATGGRSFEGPPSPADVPTRAQRPPSRADRDLDPLWDHPLWLLWVLVPLGAEWIARRRYGLS